jgi:putative ABC transport system ATP-binding protein
MNDTPQAATSPGVLGDAILEINNVKKVHGVGTTTVDALRGVSLTVQPGELVAVMGPSGAGKSTLLHLAGGLDTPTVGSIQVEGTDLASLSRADLAVLRRRFVGYVFQDFNMIPSLTGVENVSLPRELDGVAARRARDEALQLLADVGVAEVANRFPDDMAGGQQQLVAIARALVGNRRLVLADEPTGAVDSETGERVMRALRERIDAGAAGLLVTHEARYAGWADRTVFLRDGLTVDDTEQPLGSISVLEARR